MQLNQSHRFAVAPMMDWTDRHCRFFHRLLTRRALLYTEMITTGAVLHGDRARLLAFDPAEHPVALQLGGSEPRQARRVRAHRRRSRLRRGQSQCRLPVGPGAGGPLRRLPDGRAGAGRRLRRRHEGGGAHSGHRQMPHRHRRSGSGGGARSVDAARSSARASPRSSCMPARPGSPACRRARTAISRRSTMTVSTG